ncbi:hypothetical protein FBU59_006008 [Linderina macrospora]|uniref:Uncharacterized protein n=1 Tax=Linderina macrospora TaxID=4868 RepID=A0ACC1J0Y2_9FUNG|nr:hypothetical protein FBU59_006008 [Linderina macrospora]
MDLRERTKIASGGPYEDLVGYSRVLATGLFVYVAGTTASSDGSPIPATVEAQTAQTMEIIKSKLAQVSCAIDEIVRVRMFVVDIKKDWEAISQVMNRYFKEIKPVMTMVEVKGLIDDDMRIEIEVDAVRKASPA